MMELKELLMDIRKELRCADKYAREASKHKREYPNLADTYHRIATDKVSHAEMLREHAKEMAIAHHMNDAWDLEDYMITGDMDDVHKHLDGYH